MGHADALDVERADADVAHRAVLDLKDPGGEACLARHAVQPLRQPRGRDHPHSAWWVELIAEVVAERDEVDEMVGVQVADDDARKVSGLQPAGQPCEGALADVEADRGAVVQDDVAG